MPTGLQTDARAEREGGVDPRHRRCCRASGRRAWGSLCLDERWTELASWCYDLGRGRREGPRGVLGGMVWPVAGSLPPFRRKRAWRWREPCGQLLPLPLPQRNMASHTSSGKSLLLLGTRPHVINGVSYQGKSQVTLNTSLPLSKPFSKRRGLT